MVVVAQLVRALDCGSRGRGFKSHHPPKNKIKGHSNEPLFLFIFLPQLIYTFEFIDAVS